MNGSNEFHCTKMNIITETHIDTFNINLQRIDCKVTLTSGLLVMVDYIPLEMKM